MACESDNGLWKRAKWAKNRHNTASGMTPALKKPNRDMAFDVNDKAETPREAFFPRPAEADLADIERFVYPTAIECPDITTTGIEKAIRKASPNKIPGADNITNRVLQQTMSVTLPVLHKLFNACLRIGYCPKHFKESITVALRKPDKKDYTQPKSYRPIALLNTLGKALEAVIAERLAYLADTYQLLPKRHTGGRRLASTDHAIHLLLQRIHQAEADGLVATLLLLDVSGA